MNSNKYIFSYLKNIFAVASFVALLLVVVYGISGTAFSGKDIAKSTFGKSLLGIFNFIEHPLASMAFSKQGVKPNYADVNAGSVLGEADNLNFTSEGNITFNIPAVFNDNVNLKDKNLDAGKGSVFASNLLYNLQGGQGIAVGNGQTPVITNTGVISLGGQTGVLNFSAGSGININGLEISNAGVTSLGGSTGDVSLSAGSGISISGTTITNSDLGSSQNIFKKIAVSGQSNVEADSNTDTLTFAAGAGINLATDATNDKVTITNTQDPTTMVGWTAGSGNVYLTTSSDNVGIGTSAPTSKLHVIGTANITGATTLGSTLGVTGAGTFSSTLGVTGATTLSSTLNVSGPVTLSSTLDVTGGINNHGGGITNAGPITGGTGLTSSGTITFSGLSTVGLVHNTAAGVLSTSTINLSNSSYMSANVTGALPVGYGGTNITTYTTGDMLYASGATTLTKLGIGSNNQVLVAVGGVPTWTTISGATCTDCMVNDPTSTATNTITPAAGVTGLIVKQAPSGSADVFSVQNNSGSSSYLMVNSSGNVGIGTTAPGYKLDVSGTIHALGAIYTDNQFYAGDIYGLYFGSGTSRITGRSDLNQLFFTTNNSERMRIDSSGNVGIGTTAPSSVLDVRSTSAGLIQAYNTTAAQGLNLRVTTGATSSWNFENGNSELFIYNATTSKYGMQFLDSGNVAIGNSSQLYVTNAGNVGIGTTSPSYGLDLNGTLRVTGATTFNGVAYTWPGSDAAASGYALTSNGSGTLSWTDLNSSGNVGPWTLSGSNLYPDSTSYNVGIGNTAPGVKLDVTGTVRGTSVYQGANQVCDTSGNCTGSGAGIGGNGTSGYISKFTGTYNIGNSLIYDTGTNLGIGTTAPGGLLSLGSATGASKLLVYDSGNVKYGFGIPGSSLFRIFTPNDTPSAGISIGTVSILDGTTFTENFRMTQDGKLGIGTSAPSNYLHIVKSQDGPTLGIIDNVSAGNGTIAGLELRNTAASTDALRLLTFGTAYTTSGGFVQDGAAVDADSNLSGGLSLIAANSSASMRFYTGSTSNERMRIDSSGNVGIGTAAPAKKLTVIDSSNQIRFGVSNSDYLDLVESGNGSFGLYTPQLAANMMSITNFGSTVNFDRSTALTIGGVNYQGSSLFYGDLTAYRYNHTAGIQDLLTLSHQDSVAGQNNQGSGILFKGSDNGGSPTDVARIGAILTDVTGGSQDSAIVFQNRIAGAALAEVMRIEDGNVGIGTTAPTSLLYVNGTFRSVGAATLNSTLDVTGATTLSSTLNVTSNTTIGGNLKVNGTGNSYVSGNFGVGTTAPTNTLQVAGNTYISGTMKATVASTGTMGSFGANGVDDLLTFSYNGATSITGNVFGKLDVVSASGQDLDLISGSGKVGIGSIQINSQSTVGVYGNAAIGQNYSVNNAAPTNGLIVEGNVGIGTTSPSRALEVKTGTSSSGSQYIRLTHGGSSNNDNIGIEFLPAGGVLTTPAKILGIAAGSSNEDLSFTTVNGGTAAEAMRIKGSGNVGIGTTAASTLLNVVSSGQGLTSQLIINSGYSSPGSLSFDTLNAGNTMIGFDGDLVGGNFVARNTEASFIREYGSKLIFTGNTGLTSGNTYTPTERLALDLSNGNVGIGTTSPGEKLEVYNANILANRGNIKFTQETTPGAATASLVVTGTGNLTNGAYLYKITFVTSQGETEAGTASNSVTVDASHKQISLTSIPTGTAAVSSRKVYRTTAGGTTYLLQSTISDNTTTSLTDNTADASLGASAPTANTTSGGVLLGGTNRLQIDQNGNIGIGTTAPDAKLEISNVPVTGTNVYGLKLTPTISNASTNYTAFFTNMTENSYGGGSYNLMDLQVGGVSNFRVDHFGNTRIAGEINLAGPGNRIYYDSSDYMKVNTGFGWDIGSWSYTRLASNVYVTGNLGVGVTVPANNLDVGGKMVIGSSYAGRSTAPSNGLLVQGNVGIGTSTPARPLEVRMGSNGSGTNYARLTHSGSSAGDDIGLEFFPAGGALITPAQIVGIAAGNFTVDLSFVSVNSSNFGTANEAIRIKGSGKVGIGNSSPAGLLDISKALSGTPGLTGPYLSLSASTFTDNNTASSGTAGSMAFNSIAAPTLSASNTSVTTTNAYTMYIAGPPTAGTNETITNSYGLGVNANVLFGVKDGAGGIIGLAPTTTYPQGAWSINGRNSGAFTIKDTVYGADVFAIKYNTGNVGIGTTAPSYSLDVQGSTKVNSLLGYLTNGADYAEYFPNEENIPYKSLVGMNPATGKVRVYRPGDKLIGIVSSGIGFVGNGNSNVEHDSSYTLVGLLGQLEYDPSQVVVTNGEVKTLDGKTVGSLLANGKVLVKDNTNISTTLGLTLDSSGNIIADGTNAEGSLVANTISSQSTTLSTLDAKITNVDNKYATLAAELISTKTQVDTNTTDISAMKTDIQNLKTQLLLASTSAVLGTSTTNMNASDSATLTNLIVSNNTNLNNLAVTGTFTSGMLTMNGVDTTGGVTGASFNTITGPLRIQSTGSDKIEFENAKITMDTTGNIKAESITVKKINVDTSDTASAAVGEGTIVAGQTQIVINTTAVTDKSQIFVTAKTKTGVPLAVTSQANGTSFTVEINSAQSQDIKFSWWIVN